MGMLGLVGFGFFMQFYRFRQVMVVFVQVYDVVVVVYRLKYIGLLWSV